MSLSACNRMSLGYAGLIALGSIAAHVSAGVQHGRAGEHVRTARRHVDRDINPVTPATVAPMRGPATGRPTGPTDPTGRPIGRLTGQMGSLTGQMGSVSGLSTSLPPDLSPLLPPDLTAGPPARGAIGAAMGPPIGSVASEPTLPLEQKGMTAGSAIMIRVFKAESQLELWLKTDERFELFATYAICFWSGTLGPKLREGDKQAPEGLYSVGLQQLHLYGRRPHSFDIGYPNALDQAEGRTGSNILIHGGCGSIGCYAMTDTVMEEIYALAQAALAAGQERFQVHAFPFRMTKENMAMHADSPWHPFWANLREAYDLFERTHIPPKVGRCGTRYVIEEDVPSPGQGVVASEATAATCVETVMQPIPAHSAHVAGRAARAKRHRASHRARQHHADVHRKRRIHGSLAREATRTL